GQKFTTVFLGKKFGADHSRRRIHFPSNINNFFGFLRTRSIPLFSIDSFSLGRP
ncbi:MAG: hypothetical protein ACI9BH_001760, partial [Paracoccaceae bacterium]